MRVINARNRELLVVTKGVRFDVGTPDERILYDYSGPGQAGRTTADGIHGVVLAIKADAKSARVQGWLSDVPVSDFDPATRIPNLLALTPAERARFTELANADANDPTSVEHEEWLQLKAKALR